MPKIHGKNTVVLLAAVELTGHTDNSQLEFTADSHDLTVYGKNSHVFGGGLLNGSATVSGFYDSTAVSGPRALIKPLIGTVVEFIHRPEGTGAGKPQDKVSALVQKYTQTHPVAGYITWAVDLQFSDDVNATPQ